MPELDVFETRFAAAYRRYLDEAPTAVDAAAVVRTVAAAPLRARWEALRMALRPAPALAWLGIAALLLAALGAALFVGSQPERKAPAVLPPIGTTYTCPRGSNPDAPGPVDQARPPQDVFGVAAVAFDRRAGRLLVVMNAGGAIQTWTFDVCTNTWTRMHPRREPPGDGIQLVYDIGADLTVGVFADSSSALSHGESPVAVPQPRLRVWAYDLPADTWTEKGDAPLDASLSAYDPVSGRVIAADGARLWEYKAVTDAWTPIHQANVGPDRPVIAYDASVDRLVAPGDGISDAPPFETWLFDIRTGTWSKSAAERPSVVGWLVSARAVYDEAAKRTLVFKRTPLTAYDARADRWETLPDAGTTWPYPDTVVYDAVNRRLVGLGQPIRDADGRVVAHGGVAALDLVTGTWTVLLEPGPEPPAP